jgi:hypothetical protein
LTWTAPRAVETHSKAANPMPAMVRSVILENLNGGPERRKRPVLAGGTRN